MTCNEAQSRWHRQADGGGSDDGLARHLAECAGCRAYAAQMQRLGQALDVLRAQTESQLFSSGATRGDVVDEATRRPGLWVRRGWAVAAVVALAMTGYWMTNFAGRTPRAGVTTVVDTSETGFTSQDLESTVRETATDRAVAPQFGLTLKGESAAQLLAVPAPIVDPNVQMYWLYPRLASADGATEPTPR